MKPYCSGHIDSESMPTFGFPTNPSHEILGEIKKISELNFEYAEIDIEGPECNPEILNKNKKEIIKLLQKFKQRSVCHTAYWIDLCSDYSLVRRAWILEAMREIRIARNLEIDLINFHANLNGMFYGEKRNKLLDNLITSLREIVTVRKKIKCTG